jgi:hypothetical protein
VVGLFAACEVRLGTLKRAEGGEKGSALRGVDLFVGVGHLIIILFIRNSLLTYLFKLSLIEHVAIFRGIQLGDIRQ